MKISDSETQILLSLSMKFKKVSWTSKKVDFNKLSNVLKIILLSFLEMSNYLSFYLIFSLTSSFWVSLSHWKYLFFIILIQDENKVLVVHISVEYLLLQGYSEIYFSSEHYETFFVFF